MTLKELAHLAQQTLQNHAGCQVKRSHVHELLAAAFGYRSWAAFLAESLLADAGVGDRPSGTSPEVIGRAVQLGYGQQSATEMARSLLAFIAERQLSAVSWSVLGSALIPAIHVDDGDELDEDWEDEEPVAAAPAAGAPCEQLMRSPMLRHSLERAAESSNPQAHFLLAALYRCGRPNPYLYEESLGGRVLTAVERGWVDDHLRLEPQYRKYEAHLKAAALGGIRAAALEYGTAFENQEFIAMAERLTGDVDATKMARVAATPEARANWLRKAAENGSRSALEELAHQGDTWAEERVAEWGDIHWLRSAVERALEKGDGLLAWTWQYLALKRGSDLTRSTMAAYHDGGQQDGQFYDSDFGGPMYVNGDEGLVLPKLRRTLHHVAKAKANAIFSRAR
jgi:TPR repeat protein